MKSISKRFPVIIYITMLVVFLAGLVMSVKLQADDVQSTDDFDFLISEGWQTEDGTFIDTTDLTALSEGETVLEHTLPDTIRDGDSLNFDSHNVRFRIYLDGEECYSYDPRGNLTGNGNGAAYHSIPLAAEYAGEPIIMVVEPMYSNDSSSSFADMVIASENGYFRYVLREHSISFSLSFLLMFFGAVILLLQFGIPSKTAGVSLHAAGISILLIGLWSAGETTIPTLIFGHSEIWRAIDYYTLVIAEYPFVIFINSITIRKRARYEWAALGISVMAFVISVAYRIIYNGDLHNFNLFFASYCLQVILIITIIADNVRYAKANNIKHNLSFINIGILFFLAGVMADLSGYFIGDRTLGDNGFFSRMGLVVFVILIFIRIIRNVNEEHLNQMSNRFVNELLQYSLSAKSPEKIIAQMIEYLGKESKADRVYIFEEGKDGYFTNSYEWCAEGIRPEKEILKNVPFVGLLDTWFEDFGKFGYVLIDDLEEYKNKSEPMYELAGLLNIKTNLSGPLIIDGDYIGFFGIDNPDTESLRQMSYSIKLVDFFMAVMLRQRNNQRLLRQYSYRDQMTGVMNRRALEEFIAEGFGDAASIGVLMCDINGLKRVNDQLGHEAGDTMIRDVSDCMSEVFTSERVYRMGGDEFLAISLVSNEQMFNTRVRTLKLLIEARGRSASLGFVYGDPREYDFEELQKIADKLMYEDKREYYEIHADRRRRE